MIATESLQPKEPKLPFVSPFGNLSCETLGQL